MSPAPRTKIGRCRQSNTAILLQLSLLMLFHLNGNRLARVSALTTSSTDTTTEDLTTTSTDSTTTSTDPTIISTPTATSTDSTTSSKSSTTSPSPPTTTSTDSTTTATTTTTPKTTTIAPVQFVNASSVVTLNVTEDQNKILDKIVCSDVNNNTVTVSLFDVSPKNAGCSKCFQVVPCSAAWCLTFVKNAGSLDIKTCPTYNVTIVCQNFLGYQIHKLVSVVLTPNNPPTFNHSSSVVSFTFNNTREAKSGDVIYYVRAVDDEDNLLYFHMTTTPDKGNFQIGLHDGFIRATTDLACVYDQYVTFRVTVNDDYNRPGSPLILNAAFTDTNKELAITNMMGQLIQVKEGVKKTVFTIVLSDPSLTPNFTLITTPAQAHSYFTFTKNDISLTSELDYEQPIAGFQIISLYVQAIDNSRCTSEVKYIQIEVTDENEEPKMLPKVWSRTEYEGMITIAGPKSGNSLPWNVYDQDANDIITYSLQSPVAHFIIDSVTGDISSVNEYDVDGGRMSSLVTFTIVAKDRMGLSDTGTLTLNVLDSNDNSPVINPAFESLPVQDCTLVGSSIGQLSITDADSSFQGNNETYFQVQTSKYFTLQARGNIILTSPLTAGDYSSTSVYAFDKGLVPGPLMSTPGFIVVRGIPCDTTTPPTTTTPTTTTTTTLQTTTTPKIVQTNTTLGTVTQFNSLTENMPWIAASAILGTCFLGLLFHFICKYARNICKRTRPPNIRFKEPKLVQPQTPPSANNHIKTKSPNPSIPRESSPFIVGSQNAQLYGFWSTKFQ